MKLIFATNNQHKVDEIRHRIGQRFELMTMKEAGIDMDIPEPHDSIEANATEKSTTIYRITGINCFSEDTGLEIDALNGEPGVKSARYAGEEKSFQKNTDKVLSGLKGRIDRNARFRTIISLIIDGRENLFEGICSGRITEEAKGEQGFGYDPIFIPDGSEKTFAEMELKEKDLYSHRAKATEKLVAFLNLIETKGKI